MDYIWCFIQGVFNNNKRIIGIDNKGFTLLELLIAIVIGSVMLLSLFNLLKTQKKTYNAEGLITEAEQNARAASDFITRKLRMAGYMLPFIKTTLTADYSSGTILNVASTSGFDSSDPIYISGGGNFESAVISSSDTAKFNISALSASYSAGATVYQYVASSPSIIGATDSSITFYSFYENKSTTLTIDYTSGDTALTVDNTNNIVGSFNDGNWIIISDDFNTEWSMVNGNSSGTTININSSYKFTNNYSTGATVYRIDKVNLLFEDKQIKRLLNDSGGKQPVADNIDYFRYRYYDESNNLIADPDSQSNPVTARARIRKINIQVVAITSKDDPDLISDLSGTYDDGSAYSDRRHRVSLETDIFLRTLVP